MEWDKLWESLKAKNPALAKSDETEMTVTVGNMRKLLQQTHEMGRKDGGSTSSAVESLMSRMGMR